MKALSKHIPAAAKESESESPQARSVRRQCFENFEDCQLDEIVLAAASFLPCIQSWHSWINCSKQGRRGLEHCSTLTRFSYSHNDVISAVDLPHLNFSTVSFLKSGVYRYTQRIYIYIFIYTSKDIILAQTSHKRYLGIIFLHHRIGISVNVPGLQSWLSTTVAFRPLAYCPRCMPRDFYGSALSNPCSEG